jgi:hypothetical protein
MEAHRLLDAAPFEPEMIKVLQHAFDVAWSNLAPMVDPPAVEDTRLSLAHAIIAHAGGGQTDGGLLAAAALKALQRHNPCPDGPRAEPTP